MAKVEDCGQQDQMQEVLQPRGRWDYIRKKLKRRGVAEVSKSHPQHHALEAVRLGIQRLFTEYEELEAKDDLQAEDYDHVLKFNVKVAGKNYTFRSYSSCVFACLRRAVDISREDFLESLAPESLPYLEFFSNSRSGQDFFFSNNQRFVLKSDKPQCIRYFLSIIRDYLDHFLVYPHSLLVKFLGVYSVKPPRGPERFMLVMQSIFYPTPRMDERFDIKGSMCNRYQKPNPPGKKTILVLKDQNFLEETIELGLQKTWFLTQLRADVDFLQCLGVMDYSLLLGRHPTTSLDRKESVKNLVLRMRKSFGVTPKELSAVLPEVESEENSGVSVNEVPSDSKSSGNPNDCDVRTLPNGNQEIEVSTRDTTNSEQKRYKTNSPFRKMKNMSFLRSLSDSTYLDSTGMNFKNQRLLLNCKNSLHIIDGDNYRYYIGIIDFFTRFRCHQKVAKVVKDVRHCCGNHSTEPPDFYAKRFYDFISERIV